MKTKTGTFGRVDWTSINFQGSDGKLWNIYVCSFYCMYIQHWPRLLNCKRSQAEAPTLKTSVVDILRSGVFPNIRCLFGGHEVTRDIGFCLEMLLWSSRVIETML